MRRWKQWVVYPVLILVALVWPVNGQSPSDKQSSSESTETRSKDHKVILTRRANNGPYGTTAYSFRHQTQELNLHRNNVDIVFNGCGQLHINPHAGLQGGISDLGNVELEKVELADLKKVPGQSWRRFCLPPIDGHVYLHEGRYLNQRFVIAFKIKVIKPDRLELQWRSLGPQIVEDVKYRYVGAGTMGQCGGAHGQR